MTNRLGKYISLSNTKPVNTMIVLENLKNQIKQFSDGYLEINNELFLIMSGINGLNTSAFR